MICSGAQRCGIVGWPRSARSCCGPARSRSRRPGPAAPNTTPSNGDQRWKLRLPLLLPAGLQRLRPFRIGGRVAAHVDGRRGALEDVELLGVAAEVRHQLDRRWRRCRRARRACRPACPVRRWRRRRCSRSPSAPMWKLCPLKSLIPGMPGSFGRLYEPAGHDHEPGPDVVTAVGADPPALDRLVPAQVA